MSEMLAMFHQVARRGWQPEPVKGGWRLMHPHLAGAVYLSMTSHWINLVYPLDALEKRDRLNDLENIDRPNQALAERTRMYRSLLEQNEQMFMAKFCVDTNGRPLLAVEISAQNMPAGLLNWALDSFLSYTRSSALEAAEQPTEAVVLAAPEDMYHYPDETPGLPRTTVFRYIKGIETRKWLLKEEPNKAGLLWHLGYKGRRVFDGYLIVTKNWTYFQIPLLLDPMPPVLQEEDLRLQVLFLKYLLQLNSLWYMAKLGVSKDGCLLLLLEVPTEALDFSLFQTATSTLANYLDKYQQEIHIMASLQHDRQLITLLNENEHPG